MTTISGTSSAASALSDPSTTQRVGRHRGGMDAAKLFAKADTDGSGSIDSSELQAMLDKMAQRSGQPGTTTATDAMTKLDTNGDGTLDKGEFAAGLKSLMPAASSTVQFAQRHGEGHGGAASGSDGLSKLFKAIDTNGDNTLSSTEVSAFADKVGAAVAQAVAGSTASSTSTGTTTGSTGTSHTATTVTSTSTGASTDGSSQGTSNTSTGFDISAFVNMVMRQYGAMAGATGANLGQQSLSVAA